VTLVAVLTILQGLLEIGAGVVLLLNQHNPELRLEHLEGFGIVATAYLTIGVGVLIVAAGTQLFRGSRGARVFVTFFMLLSIGAAIYVMIVEPEHFWSALVGGLLALAVLGLLWTGKAAVYFAESP
jgi:hypothetical protein